MFENVGDLFVGYFYFVIELFLVDKFVYVGVMVSFYLKILFDIVLIDREFLCVIIFNNFLFVSL